eukprot:3365298-Rhodomonas_salina.3
MLPCPLSATPPPVCPHAGSIIRQFRSDVEERRQIAQPVPPSATSGPNNAKQVPRLREHLCSTIHDIRSGQHVAPPSPDSTAYRLVS